MRTIRADCKIVQASLHAREGDPAYTARAIFEVLELAEDLVDEVIVGASWLSGYTGTTVTAAHWSADSGRTWTRTEGWTAGLYYTTDLMETSTGDVFASNGSSTAGKLGEIWKSTDRGRSWRRVYRHASERYVYSLCEAKNGNLVAGTGTVGKFLLSTDGGESWAQVAATAANRSILDIVMAANGDLLAGVGRTSTQGEIYRSQDDGATWNFLQSFLPTTGGYVTCLTKLSSGVLLAGTSYLAGQVWRSVDDGATWAKLSTLPGQSSVESLICNADDVVYATSTYDQDVWRSYDGGATWASSEAGTTGNSIYSVGILSNGNLLAGSGADRKVRRSTDGGFIWDQSYSLIKVDPAAQLLLVLSRAQT